MDSVPLHPAIVHFPLAFVVLEAILLVMRLVKNDLFYRDFAVFTFKVAFIALAAALISGYLEAGGWEKIFKYAAVRSHFLAASSLFIVFVVRAVLWSKVHENQPKDKWVHLLGTVVGCCVAALTGYLGALLVYGHHTA